MALYKAVYDFEGQEATELSVKQGEVLVAKGPPADDWLLVSLQRDPTRSGYVPVGYVERMEAAAPGAPPAAPAAARASLAAALFNFPAGPAAPVAFPAPVPAAGSEPFGFGFAAAPLPAGQPAPAFPPALPSGFGFEDSPPPFGGPSGPGSSLGGFPAPAPASGSLFGSAPAFPPPDSEFNPNPVPQPNAEPPAAPAPPPEETWSFPGGLPRMPLTPPTPAALYPILPASQPIESLQAYEAAFEAQPPGPNFAEVDRVLEEATAALHRLKQQHFLTSAQLQLVRARLEVEGGSVRRQRAAMANAQTTAPLTVHEVEPDPLPAVEFTYQKFLTPGKNYTPAVPTAPMVGATAFAHPAAPAHQLGASPPEAGLPQEAPPTAPASNFHAVPDFPSMSPREQSSPLTPPDGMGAEEDDTAALERQSFALLDKAAMAVQEVRDRCEALALTPLAEASDVNNVVNARKAYDELLLQQMMKVDAVDSHGIASIRLRRKEMLRDIEKLHHNLDELIKGEMERARG